MGATGSWGALASASDTPISRRYLEWSDVARIAALAGQLGRAAPAPAPGSTPKTGPRWLSAFGIGRPLASLGITTQLDRVLASGHVFGAGAAMDSLRTVLGRAGGTMLGADPSYQAAARCFGNPLWAVILPGAMVDAGAGSSLVAIGGERPRSASAPVANVLCAVDSSDAAAQAHVARLQRSLGPQGLLFALNQPVSAVASGAEVDRADADGRQVARATLTLRGSASAAFLYQELRRGELATLIGTTCPSSTPGRSVRPATRRAICRRLGLPPPTR